MTRVAVNVPAEMSDWRNDLRRLIVYLIGLRELILNIIGLCRTSAEECSEKEMASRGVWEEQGIRATLLLVYTARMLGHLVIMMYSRQQIVRTPE